MNDQNAAGDNLYTLIINPGSTSTKISVYQGESELFRETMSHMQEKEMLDKRIQEQKQDRKDAVLQSLKSHQINLSDIGLITARGGLMRPLESGTYEVNDKMISDLSTNKYGEHASNLGAVIGMELSRQTNEAPVYITDPVVVDELGDLARFTGIKSMERKSIFHALNQKAAAKKAAAALHKQYEELQLIVIHLGGGISVGAHAFGKVIDVNNGLDGEGPFSPERAGTLPVGDVIKEAYSGMYTESQLKKRYVGNGGLKSYFETSDTAALEQRKDAGETEIDTVLRAMVYQTAKEAGAMASVLKGQVDALIVTGGMANSSWICRELENYISWIAPVLQYPGEDEIAALFTGAYNIWKTGTKAKKY